MLAGALGLTSTTLPSFASTFDTVTIVSNETSKGAYDRVYIAPVKVDIKGRQTGALARLRSNSLRFSTSEADEKAEELYQALSLELTKKFELVSAPGPGILTVSPTITRLAPSRSNNVEGARNVGRDQIRSVSAGEAKIELTLSDADTVLIKIKDHFQATFNDGAPRVSRWQDVDDAFFEFSRKVGNYLEKY